MSPHALRQIPLEWFLDCLALIFPAQCIGCGCADRALCSTCAQLTRAPHAAPPDATLLTGVPTFAAGPYEGVPRAALIALKHRGAIGVARVLGIRLAVPLASAIEQARAGPPLVVTVPSRNSRVRERGFRHVDELVRHALRNTGQRAIPCRALRPLRGRTGQVGLQARARETNAARVGVRPSVQLSGREVVLVDDICTTGASIRAAIRALEAAEARVISVALLCVSERRDTRGQ